MTLKILLTDNKYWVELENVEHFVYRDGKMDYTQRGKIYTLDNILGFSSEDSEDSTETEEVVRHYQPLTETPSEYALRDFKAKEELKKLTGMED